MTEATDVREKAKAFFSLWQEQVAVLARDPEAMAATLKTLLAMQEACYTSHPKEMKQPNAADVPQQPSTVSPLHDVISSVQLAARLAQCEARIAELESALAKRGRSSSKRTSGNFTTSAA